MPIQYGLHRTHESVKQAPGVVVGMHTDAHIQCVCLRLLVVLRIPLGVLWALWKENKVLPLKTETTYRGRGSHTSSTSTSKGTPNLYFLSEVLAISNG